MSPIPFTVLVYELDLERRAPRCCFLCLDPAATVFVRNEGVASVRGICTECISCLVTAGLQGRVTRHLESDETEVPTRS